MTSICNLEGMIKVIATQQTFIATQQNLSMYEMIAITRSRATPTADLLFLTRMQQCGHCKSKRLQHLFTGGKQGVYGHFLYKSCLPNVAAPGG